MERVMIDLTSDLRKLFDSAMWNCLEAYEVLPDGKSFVRSDEDERAIGLFKSLYESVDAIPPSLIATAEELRSVEPELFEKLLAQEIGAIGLDCCPTSATEFVESLNRTVRRDIA
jgi:hypothetical protein